MAKYNKKYTKDDIIDHLNKTLKILSECQYDISDLADMLEDHTDPCLTDVYGIRKIRKLRNNVGSIKKALNKVIEEDTDLFDL